MSTDKAEPPDSVSSSPDDTCAKCDHWRELHDQGESHCRVCHAQNLGKVACGHAFAPAEPETECQHRDAYQITGDKLGRPGRRMGYVCETCGEVWMKTAPEAEPCYCGCPPGAHMGRPSGCMEHGFHEYIRKSFAPDEPEAEPECPHNNREWAESATRWKCTDCGFEPEPPECALKGACPVPEHCTKGCRFAAQLRGERLMPRTEAEAPRRPPYAVAYAIQGGAQYEIALPGDASVRAVDGALQITHDSAVLALSHVRPMEGQC